MAPKRGNGKNGGAATRSMGERVLAQGVGVVSRHAFAQANDLSKDDCANEETLSCWDARTLCHLPLPRPIGPYTVIRVTKRFGTDSPCLLFGTFYDESVQRWTNISAIGPIPNGSQSAISTPLGTTRYTQTLGFGQAATCVPSALTVQVLNPNALQNANGVQYHGLSTVQADFGNDNQTWEQRFDQFVQYQAPRMLSGGKLALRGVQTSSYPLNMNALAEFTTLEELADSGDFTWDQTLRPRGFAPIFMYNIDGEPLEYLVTTEWRVRFDLTNPASAGHSFHRHCTDDLWGGLTELAASRGCGVLDIPDVAATGGVRYGM